VTTTTTKGLLWEMVAPAARWPLRSPARLVAVIVAVLLVVWGFGRLAGGDEGGDLGPAGATGSSEPSITVSASPTPTASATATATASPTADPVAAAVVVAARFVKAWARPDLTRARWLAGLNAVGLDEGLSQALTLTDPATIPARRATGSPKLLDANATAAQVQVTTDGPTVLVILTRTKPGEVWLASNILPVKDPAVEKRNQTKSKSKSKSKPKSRAGR
jgi:hypothetical protein